MLEMMILLCFFFLFLVTIDNLFTIPAVKENTTVNEAPAKPTGIPTTVARDTTLRVPKVADKTIQALSI